MTSLYRFSRNGASPEGTSDSGRTGFFPVGTDRPARRRPAALDRPGHSRPLRGRLGLLTRFEFSRTRPNTTCICVPPSTDCTRPRYIYRRTPVLAAFFSQRNSTRFRPCTFSPRRGSHSRRSTIPQGHAWTPPSQPPLRGGGGASRRHWCPPFGSLWT